MTDACGDGTILDKDVPLNAAGIQQIEQLHDVLLRRGVRIGRVYASPTKRTRHTAAILNGSGHIVVDRRLLNKQVNDDLYAENLKNLFTDIGESDVMLVTHGRIVKMIYSFLLFGEIRRGVTDSLSMDYGSLSIFERDISGVYRSIEFNTTACLKE